MDRVWTFNGLTPRTASRGILTLGDVTRDDAGTYRCQLSFDGAEIEGAFVDFELTVHCECLIKKGYVIIMLGVLHVMHTCTYMYILTHAHVFPDPPVATTTEAANEDIVLGGELVLTCYFDGIPTPSVTWLLNNTEVVNPDADGVTITTENGVTTLMINGLGRDDGGVYSCNFNNSVNTLQVNTTEVLVLSKLTVCVRYFM